MPYKDPTKQREYVRNWRRMQKLHTAAQHTQLSAPSPTATPALLSVQHLPTSSLAVGWKQGMLVAPASMPPVVDQRALKTSPDGAPQTGREATQAYQVSRGQLSALRTSPMCTRARRPAVPLSARRSRYVAMPVAALLVEVLFRVFS